MKTTYYKFEPNGTNVSSFPTKGDIAFFTPLCCMR